MLAVALTALLLALEARRRYGRRAAWLAGILFVVVDGRVRAPGRSGRELRDLHAARRWSRGWSSRVRGKALSARAPRSPSRRSPNRPASPRSSRSSTCSRVPRGRRGVTDAAVGFAVPVAVVALLVGPGQLLFWTVLGNGSYVGVKTASDVRAQQVRADDTDLGRLQHSDPVQAAARVARPEVDLARRSVRRRSVALAHLRRRHGRDRAAVLRPLLHADRAAAVPLDRRRARRAALAAPPRPSSRSRRPAASRSQPPDTSCGPSTPSPTTRP